MRSVEAHKGRRLNRIQGWLKTGQDCIRFKRLVHHGGDMAANGGSAERGRRMELDVTGEDWGKKKDIFRLTFQKPLSFWGNMGEDVEI